MAQQTNNAKGSPFGNTIDRRLQQIFAQVTRYPVEILSMEAHLEEDLGIDSVKLAEILAVVKEEYQLPEDLVLKPEEMQSIKSISNELNRFMKAQGNPKRANRLEASDRPIDLQDTGSLLLSVQEVFAQVTRYPMAILEADAHLEEDLGIDSVKLAEVLGALREKFNLPEDLHLDQRQLASISSITSSLESYLGGAQRESKRTAVSLNAERVAESRIDLSEDSFVIDGRVDTNFSATVRQVFADITRYPLSILEETALLEEDLGIDSVKLAEILSVLRVTYNLPEDIELTAESLQTIQSISKELEGFVRKRTGVKNDNHNGNSIVNGGKLNGVHLQRDPKPSRVAPAKKNSQARPLDGKVTFVSGSGRGLGKEIALHLSQLGAEVIVNSFHSRDLGEETCEEIKSQNGKARHIWGSMANPKHVDRIFDEIEDQYGYLDFFISNASNGMLAKLEDLKIEHWEKAFRTNIVGLHQGALRSVKLMKKKGSGKIITLSSPASQGYVDYFGCMGAVKAAVESLTRSMAIEFAPYNIQVNCVSPGPIYGTLLDKWPESERLVKKWEDNTAYERLCEGSDVANFIAYLLGDDVKIFTGSVLVMDGGISSQGW